MIAWISVVTLWGKVTTINNKNSIINNDVTWSDTVYVQATVTVPSGRTLKIAPGTKVFFQGAHQIFVAKEGKIQAVGNEADTILFDAPDYPTTGVGWKGIKFDFNYAVQDTVLFAYCRFQHVVMEKFGAVILCMLSSDPTHFKFSHCTFSHNNAGKKFAYLIYVGANSVTLEHTDFYNNRRWGDLIYIDGSFAIRQTRIVNNEFHRLLRNSYFKQVTRDLTHCLIANNRVISWDWREGQLFTISDGKGTFHIRNSIFYNNPTDQNKAPIFGRAGRYYTLNLEIRNSRIAPPLRYLNRVIPCYENLYEEDPLFVRPSAKIGYDSLATQADWRLQDTSPLIDRGDSAYLSNPEGNDLAGNRRWVQQQPDVGPYEVQHPKVNPHIDKPVVVKVIDQFTGKPLPCVLWKEAGKQTNEQGIAQDTFPKLPQTMTLSKADYLIHRVRGIIRCDTVIFLARPQNTYLAQTISSDVVWKDTVFVTGNITVANGGKLTIQPGTHILFTGGYHIRVTGSGKMEANGTKTDSILFANIHREYTEPFPSLSKVVTLTPLVCGYQPPPIVSAHRTGWGGIHLNSVSQTSTFSYCRFLDGRLAGGGQGMIDVRNSPHTRLTIAHSEIFPNFIATVSDGRLFHFQNAGTIQLKQCKITNSRPSRNFRYDLFYLKDVRKLEVVSSQITNHTASSLVQASQHANFESNLSFVNCLIANNNVSDRSLCYNRVKQQTIRWRFVNTTLWNNKTTFQQHPKRALLMRTHHTEGEYRTASLQVICIAGYTHAVIDHYPHGVVKTFWDYANFTDFECSIKYKDGNSDKGLCRRYGAYRARVYWSPGSYWNGPSYCHYYDGGQGGFIGYTDPNKWTFFSYYDQVIGKIAPSKGKYLPPDPEREYCAKTDRYYHHWGEAHAFGQTLYPQYHSDESKWTFFFDRYSKRITSKGKYIPPKDRQYWAVTDKYEKSYLHVERCYYDASQLFSETTDAFTLSTQKNNVQGNRPHFASPSTAIGDAPGADTADWSLKKGSPLINSGTLPGIQSLLDTTDLAGKKRIVNGIDIGPYEYEYGFPPNFKLQVKNYRTGQPMQGILWNEADTLTDPNGYAHRKDENSGKLGYGKPLSLTPTVDYDFFSEKPFISHPDDTAQFVGVHRCHYIQKKIKDKVVWDCDTVLVLEDLTVGEGDTLLIRPGVQVLFDGDYQIRLTENSFVRAEGRATDTIRFALLDTTGYLAQQNTTDTIGWRGFLLDAGHTNTTDTSLFTHCHFEHLSPKTGKALIKTDNDLSPVRLSNSLFANNLMMQNGTQLVSINDVPSSKNRFQGNRSLSADSSTTLLFLRSPYSTSVQQSLFANNTASTLIGSNNASVLLLNNTLTHNQVNHYLQGNNFSLQNTILADSTPLASFVHPSPIKGYDPQALTYDWHLHDTCLLINRADTTGIRSLLDTTDLAENPRIKELLDWGAYEHQKPLPANFHIRVYNRMDSLPLPGTYWEQANTLTNAQGMATVKHRNEGKLGYGVKLTVSKEDYTFKSDFPYLHRPEDTAYFIGTHRCHYTQEKMQPNTVWDCDTITVLENLTVGNNSSLTILPGVTVLFHDDYHIKITGTGSVRAEGTKQDTIRFLSKLDYWDGIQFTNMQQDAPASLFRYCRIEEGNSRTYGGAIRIVGFDGVSIEHCLFYDNYAERGGGALAFIQSTTKITHSQFTRNNTEGAGSAIMSFSNQNSPHSLTLTGSIFDSNYSARSATIYTDLDSLTILNSLFYENLNSLSQVPAVVKNALSGDQRTLVTALHSRRGTTRIYNSLFIQPQTDKILSQVKDKGSISLWNSHLSQKNHFPIIENNPQAEAPQFVAPERRDFRTHLYSPLINRGTTAGIASLLPAQDFGDTLRIIDNNIDLGPYEFPRPLTPKDLTIKVVATDGTPLQGVGFEGLPFQTDQEGVVGETDKQTLSLETELFPIKPILYDRSNPPSHTIDKWNREYLFTLFGQCRIPEITFENSDETWACDTMHIFGNITVAKDATLTIKEGVTVLFYGHYGLKITQNGQLTAEGTETDTIRMKSQEDSATTGWTGVTFEKMNPDAPHSSLKYLRMEQVKKLQEDAGGALSIYQFSNISLSHLLLTKNMGNLSAALRVEGTEQDSLKITHSTFSHNLSERAGAGVYAATLRSLHLAHCRFLHNQAQEGAAILTYRIDTLTLTYSYLMYNHATDKGAVLSSYVLSPDSRITIGNSLIAENQTDGRAILAAAYDDTWNKWSKEYSTSYQPPRRERPLFQLEHLTLTANRSDSFSISLRHYEGDIYNSILSENTTAAGEPFEGMENTYYRYSLLPKVDLLDLAYHESFALPPHFKEAAHQDYRLSEHSPAIERGGTRNPSKYPTDLLGHPRVRGQVPDMGAFEFHEVNITLSVRDTSPHARFYHVFGSTLQINDTSYLDATDNASFTLPLPPGRYPYTLTHDSYKPYQDTLTVLAQEGQKDSAYMQLITYRVRFFITDTAGRAVHYAVINFDKQKRNISYGAFETTYRPVVRTTLGDGYSYHVSAPRYYPVAGNLHPTSDTTIYLIMTPMPPRYDVTVKVFDGNEPVQKEYVLYNEKLVLTDPYGAAFFPETPSGKNHYSYYDEIAQEDYRDTVDVQSDTVFTIQLQKKYPLRFKVMDHITHQPIPQALVWVNEDLDSLTDQRGFADIVVVSRKKRAAYGSIKGEYGIELAQEINLPEATKKEFVEIYLRRLPTFKALLLTPNDDGYHDRLEIDFFKGLDTRVSLSVYTREGEPVHKENYQHGKGWDGKATEGIYRGKLVPVGEYILFIDAPILGGKAGYVLIVKH